MELIPEKGNTQIDPEAISTLASNHMISGLTEMFRDPEIFQIIRTDILPYLETFMSFNVWHAGCSTGEEAYSMAILLSQASLLGKATLFATDKYQHRLLQGKRGRYSSLKFSKYASNFLQCGLSGKLDDYLIRNHSYMQLAPDIISSTHFFQHDLTLGGRLNTFSCIFCRNVLIYYSPQEQTQLLQKILDSLEPMGFLILGHVEDLRFSPLNKHLKLVRKGYPIYQKVTF